MFGQFHELFRNDGSVVWFPVLRNQGPWLVSMELPWRSRVSVGCPFFKTSFARNIAVKPFVERSGDHNAIPRPQVGRKT